MIKHTRLAIRQQTYLVGTKVGVACGQDKGALQHVQLKWGWHIAVIKERGSLWATGASQLQGLSSLLSPSYGNLLKFLAAGAVWLK